MHPSGGVLASPMGVARALGPSPYCALRVTLLEHPGSTDNHKQNFPFGLLFPSLISRSLNQALVPRPILLSQRSSYILYCAYITVIFFYEGTDDEQLNTKNVSKKIK